MKNEMLEKLTALPLECGAFKANVIKTEKIETDRRFRDMCEANSCGIYGKCWMCPLDVGDIDLLMGEIAKYDYALVYQPVVDLLEEAGTYGTLCDITIPSAMLLKLKENESFKLTLTMKDDKGLSVFSRTSGRYGLGVVVKAE